MNGSDNLLRVDNAENALIRVLVKEVTLQGCAKDCGVNQGGLIYNNEYLGLEYVKLTGGFAGQGVRFTMSQPCSKMVLVVV
ncbi:hypothetical protein LZ086_07355 [Acinetobacter johnsonii]|nr:hypothetical protein LZ086_07355 [Acinetobacter johnsonii]